MKLSLRFKKEVDALAVSLTNAGLSDRYNSTNLIPQHGGVEVLSVAIAAGVSASWGRDEDYVEYYERVASKGAYSLMLLDGAFIQFYYVFGGKEIISHKLAYLPSPETNRRQRRNPDAESIFADVVHNRDELAAFRFDYDARDKVAIDVRHPVSHFTLARCEGCRIPVSSYMSPNRFADFVLRNFYEDDFYEHEDELALEFDSPDETITRKEKNLVHFAFPCQR